MGNYHVDRDRTLGNPWGHSPKLEVVPDDDGCTVMSNDGFQFVFGPLMRSEGGECGKTGSADHPHPVGGITSRVLIVVPPELVGRLGELFGPPSEEP